MSFWRVFIITKVWAKAVCKTDRDEILLVFCLAGFQVRLYLVKWHPALQILFFIKYKINDSRDRNFQTKYDKHAAQYELKNPYSPLFPYGKDIAPYR